MTLLFRIDRRLVNISGIKFNKIDRKDADETSEVDAEGDLPEAAASMKETSYIEDTVNEYLTAAERDIQEKRDMILEQARDQAATIIFRANEDAEEERKKGWQEGFEDGAGKGRHEYEEKLAEKIKEDDEALKRVLDEIYEERERTFNELESETTSLAIEIVRKLINPPVAELEDIFTPLIKNALRQMPTEGRIVIRVGAAEYERFFSSGAAEIELDSGVTVNASVIKDLSLNEGDCIIDTEDVTINAGIDSQLRYVQLAFERANQYEPE